MTEEWVFVPFEVDKRFDGFRVDRYLSQRLVAYSRGKVQAILKEARVSKDGRPLRASAKVRTGDKIQVAYRRRPEEPLAADARLPVLFEDDDLLVIDKPSGLLSHPTDKVALHTVLGVLRQSRAGVRYHLLHRLDRETSGVLALAKNIRTARAWSAAMTAHQVQKEYVALVKGIPSPPKGEIRWPIGCQGGAIRVRQWVNGPEAVPAVTHYEVVAPGAVSVIRVFPKTGRLHQIRVHMAALGYPLLGDPLYQEDGAPYLKMIAGTLTEGDRESLGFPRVALHAAALTFTHPGTKASLRIEAPMPEDMRQFVGVSALAGA